MLHLFHGPAQAGATPAAVGLGVAHVCPPEPRQELGPAPRGIPLIPPGQVSGDSVMATAVEVGVCLLAQIHALVLCQRERWQFSTILSGDPVTTVKGARC